MLIRKGYQSFKESVSNAAKLMRAHKNTEPFVGKISARQWKAAYNSVAEFIEGTDSEEAVNALTPSEVEEIVGNVAPKEEKEPWQMTRAEFLREVRDGRDLTNSG